MGSRTDWQRNPLIRWPLAGWLAGFFWWTGLIIALHLPNVVALELEEQLGSIASLVLYAPVIAIPWAVVWALVGVANTRFRGYWVAAVAGTGMVIGGVLAVAARSFDGWLWVFVMAGCLGGTLVGLVVGGVTRATWGWLRGKEGSLERPT